MEEEMQEPTVPMPAAPSPEAAPRRLPITDLEPDPFQPRKEFHAARIRELADSLEQHGLLQPLIVRPAQGPERQGKYWIVGGERRYRAAQLLGWDHLTCQVVPFANLTAAVVALAENVHREDLNEIEKADALRRIKQMTGKSWDAVASLVRLSPEYVRRLAGLLKLEEPVKEMVRRGDLSARTAIALKPLPPQRQLEMAQRVLAEGLTAEQVRSETPRQPRVRSTRTTEPSEGPLVFQANEAPPSAGASDVEQGLQTCLRQLEEIDAWLSGRSWAPRRLSQEERELVHRLYHTASQLQQQAARIRGPLREFEALEAETGPDAGLPF